MKVYKKHKCLDCDSLCTRKALYCKSCGYKHRIRPTGVIHPIYTKPNPGWFKKGESSWKGHKHSELTKQKISQIHKGKHLSPATEFKKNQLLGNKNYKWRGDNVGYDGLHTWLYRKLGKAKICSDCGSNNRIQWANISKEYKRDINDWKQLCEVCHRKFDGITKLSKEDAREIRSRYSQGELQKHLAQEYKVDQGTISHLVNNRIKFYN